jgi:hypothetical protein
MSERLLLSQKEVANEIGRSRRFVYDMTRGGFRLPATMTEVVSFLRTNPVPTRFRKIKKAT